MDKTRFVVFKQMPWYHHVRYSLERSQIRVRSPFIDNELEKLALQAPEDSEENKAIAYRFIKEGNNVLADVATDRGNTNKPSFIPNRAWRWSQEFLPRAEYVYDYGMPQWLSRIDGRLKWLGLERPWVGRQKYCHFRVWYRDQLADYVRDTLLDSNAASRNIFDAGRLEELVSKHIKGTGNYTSMIHKLLAYETMHETLLQ